MTIKTGRVAAALLTVAMLSGCTAVGVRELTATPTPGAAADRRGLAPGIVVATGTFTGFVDGSGTTAPRPEVQGTIEVSTHNGRLMVSLLDLDVGPVANTTILELNALDGNATSGDFRVATSYLGDSEVTTATTQTFDLGYDTEMVTTDPSWMRTAVIWERVDGIGTLGRALATAPLTWTLPDQDPDLTVTDAGAGDLARGEVHYDSAGNPSAYVVAPLDALETIAIRFGITEHDILWLNPMRGYGMARAGETLNLSLYERGR
ncbi:MULTISPECIES: LysM peptidoglycan-binding domain-containing protein [Cryobacterium]|uniref:LysM peptidoglycan-binding domain-containing protein n=1 Tax=Cryobacterium TaxID=69578 RepID=UPI0010570796|nr:MULTISPECIES: LysM domain-containing protein [Cryobacterium]TFC44771.1 LysM domain-containing protein [Cryobacterium sp. TMN-39-2]